MNRSDDITGAPIGDDADPARIGGVILAKLFPNPDEPYRGIFVADQMSATADRVDWSVVAPVPWVPRAVARALGKPWTKGTAHYREHPVAYPRYPVLPRRIGYATAAPLIARTARRVFRDACASVNARIVHVHDLYPTGAAGRRLCEGAGLPYVLTVHGLDLYSNLKNPRWASAIRYAAEGARAIACVGERLAEDVVTLLGADPRRVLVLPNTYDTARFTYVPRHAPTGRIRLVTLGRLSYEKGHDVLVRALERVVASGVDVELTVIGDGPERSSLESLSAGSAVGDRITFTGTLLGDDVPARFAEADVFVLPSRQEGFGVALIEAMATGLPAVATRSGGPDGIVGPGDGVLVDADDEVALADGILELVATLGVIDGHAIAERAAARYAPAAVGARLVRLYREALDDVAVYTGSLADGGPS